MTDSRCEWVRSRLPLLATELLDENGRDQGDLTPVERDKIHRHLEQCSDCRQCEGSLGQAVETLAAVGREPSATVPSLWPALELRIRGKESPSSGWRGLTHRWSRLIGPLRDELPLRNAWNHDTILGSKALLERFQPESRRTVRLTVSLAAAAGLLIAVAPFLGRGLMVDPPVAAPIVDRIESPVPGSQDLVLDQDGDDETEADPPVVHAESPRSGTPSGIASNSPVRPPAPSRLSNDVDSPNPRPIDLRDAKPAY